ncbi:phage tail protein [Leuconostoc mesenteroides]|uniref:phage tail protein n=1 Tax=Leuconostoc mesenteroides TaxID=1245 RepID=UPI00385FF5BC
MITFKNIAGNKFLAVGTIQRKSALNGEKSLTGTLYDGDDVLNKIDKGWSLEFDNEPYIVTYFERNDNDNSVPFDAIHKFFWDMAKNVLYSETSGSHTIKWYLDQIFANTGYSYALNFNPNAIAKDNWGMKNKLSLFNDVITSIEGEFEINGTLVSIFKNIGTDLSTIVRYGFNLSDMTIENDASGFVTYGEGFGAYADQENMTGDRLHVTYTSPLASVYGKLQAEPIDDQRYTIESNLLDAVKSQVDASFSISVNLSLYDLSVAGYPYKMANVGDWLTAVDENLDFKQRIRIISIDDEFAADGTRISYSVTAGDIGLTKKYQDANASIANKVEDAVISAGQAATDANIALIAANGKNKSYHLNDINDLPKTANEGDLAWVQSGDGRVLYIYTKKADGTYYWEKRIDPEMGEQIEAGVNEAIAQANENTATAIEENNASQQEVMNDIAKSQADLAIKDGDFNNKAQAMADKALSDAKANTATVAKETLDTATDNLNIAKQSLTTDLQKEISDRTDAVAALDSKAQGYADSAKQDAIAAATTADGTINKKIDETASSLTSKITQNKQDADGKITTAQSTATQALNEVKTKVSQTEYNAKTGQLTTDVNSVTQTANQSKQDIVSINQKDGNQDARMNTIESDASGTMQTVSQLQTVQGQQSGSISTLQQRADGFDATVTKINNVVNGLGQTNQLMNTEFTPDFQSWTQVSTAYRTTGNTKNGSNVVKVVADDGDYLYQDVAVSAGVVSFSSIMEVDSGLSVNFRFGINFRDSNHNYVSAGGTTWGTNNTGALGYTLQKVENIAVPSGAAYVRINYQFRGTGVARFFQPMLVFSATVGTYVQGNYNNNDALTKVKLTADQTSLDLSNYKTDADGRISKAQTDIVATAKDVTTKVSQTDYDTKTGDLTTKVSKAQQTADSATTTIGSYKTSNDNRVSAAETKISQNTDAINLRATKTDLDSAKNDYTAKISQVNIDINGIESSVSDIQGKVNSLGQTNQLFNTEFSPDFEGWSQVSTAYRTTGNTRYGSNVVKVVNDDGDYLYQDVPVGSGSVSFSTFMQVDDGINGNFRFIINFRDSDHKYISSAGNSWGPNNTAYLNYTLQKLENIPVPAGAAFVRVQFQFRGTGVARFLQPMLVFNSTVGSYVQGNYSNNGKIAAQQITIDGITNTVTQQGTNIDSVTKRVTTAEGTLSTVTNNISDLQTSVTQTANQVTQEITDRKTGDTNTLQSSKDFTQSSITSAVNGVNSTITQTSDSLIAKINTKTDSDTVLSLLKDNWSIGITDNIGAITSGIVGNSSSMSLISKNVIIDSPSTQITGTAWINSAMIKDGSIGTAQIGDAAITNAKIANLDVSKITGNVTNFIQSYWNGVYGSTTITNSGMTIVSPGTVALFNVNGMTLDGAGGMTRVANGFTQIYSATHENIGMIGHQKDVDHDNVDYITFGLNGYRTTNEGDSHWVGGSDFYGGDGMGFGVSNKKGTYDLKLRWDSDLIAGYKGEIQGWHASDAFIFDDKTYHKGYADFSGGVTMSGAYSEGTRSLHTQGMSISTGAKWFGFMDSSNSTGFGTDQTNDVLFYVKGQVYSLYTMLGKLGMR